MLCSIIHSISNSLSTRLHLEYPIRQIRCCPNGNCWPSIVALYTPKTTVHYIIHYVPRSLWSTNIHKYIATFIHIVITSNNPSIYRYNYILACKTRMCFIFIVATTMRQIIFEILSQNHLVAIK